jgi:hypothetical protein
MNWQRGLKRITFLVSIGCAMWAGIHFYQNGTSVITEHEVELAQLRSGYKKGGGE